VTEKEKETNSPTFASIQDEDEEEEEDEKETGEEADEEEVSCLLCIPSNPCLPSSPVFPFSPPPFANDNGDVDDDKEEEEEESCGEVNSTFRLIGAPKANSSRPVVLPQREEEKEEEEEECGDVTNDGRWQEGESEGDSEGVREGRGANSTIWSRGKEPQRLKPGEEFPAVDSAAAFSAAAADVLSCFFQVSCRQVAR
jgi:hypothetical protein